MRTAVALGIMLLVGALGLLIMYLLLRRILLAWMHAYESRRKRRLQAAIQPWFRGETDAPALAFSKLRRWPDRKIFVDLCLEWLPTADGQVRDQIRRQLAKSGHIDAWIRDLKNRDPWKRERAAELLGIIRPKEAVNPLLEALADEKLDVRMRAAAALGKLGGARARAALIKALTDHNRWSAIRITDLLSTMGPEVGDELLSEFPHMNRPARLAAIDLAARVSGSASGEFFRSLLADEDVDIRARSATALGRVGYRAAIPDLLQSLSDGDWPVRAMAAKSLGIMQVEEAIPLLCAGLRDREWWVRANSAAALRSVGPPGIEALRTMTADEDRFARDQAQAALAEAERVS